MWTWTRGKCYLMSGRVWSKEADPGSVSGGHHCLQDPLIARSCSEKKQTFSCLLRINQRNSSEVSVQNECLKIVDNNNTVLQSSSHSSLTCHTLPDIIRDNADLETLRRDIAGLSCPHWSSWSQWSRCDQCTRTRQRQCRGVISKTERQSKTCGNCKESVSSLVDERSLSPPPSSSLSSSSCVGRCGDSPSPGSSCQCHAWCSGSGSCCQDYQTVCKKAAPISFPQPTIRPVSSPPGIRSGLMSVDEYSKYLADVDLGQFFEDLLRDDRNTVDLDLDTGCRTRKGGARDCSAGPLIKSVGEDIWRRPVYKRLRYLYNNYEESVKTSEDRTSFERREEQNFLTEIMKTNTMKTTLMFLKAKGLFNKSEPEFKKLLTQLWFDIYSRGQRIQSSSGFEHVFMGEKKDGKVQGFHNWAFFYDQEQKHQVNYLGHTDVLRLGDHLKYLQFTFTWGREQKIFASFLLGSSPEFEMALYTTCLLAQGETCRFKLFGQNLTLITHTFFNGKNVASAFFKI